VQYQWSCSGPGGAACCCLHCCLKMIDFFFCRNACLSFYLSIFVYFEAG
jgi:hypothetical protein